MTTSKPRAPRKRKPRTDDVEPVDVDVEPEPEPEKPPIGNVLCALAGIDPMITTTLEIEALVGGRVAIARGTFTRFVDDAATAEAIERMRAVLDG